MQTQPLYIVIPAGQGTLVLNDHIWTPCSSAWICDLIHSTRNHSMVLSRLLIMASFWTITISIWSSRIEISLEMTMDCRNWPRGHHCLQSHPWRWSSSPPTTVPAACPPASWLIIKNATYSPLCTRTTSLLISPLPSWNTAANFPEVGTLRGGNCVYNETLPGAYTREDKY